MWHAYNKECEKRDNKNNRTLNKECLEIRKIPSIREADTIKQRGNKEK